MSLRTGVSALIVSGLACCAVDQLLLAGAAVNAAAAMFADVVLANVLGAMRADVFGRLLTDVALKRHTLR
jgi:hypothetical protein